MEAALRESVLISNAQSAVKVISGRISVRPKIKVITRWCYFRKECSQGLSGFSAAPLTSSAPLRDECRLSRVGLGYAFRPSGAAATDTPRLASSRYRLARLRADRTLPLHLCLFLLETIKKKKKTTTKNELLIGS